MALLQATTTWYGPVVVRFPVLFAGNPQDPEFNDVRVKFIGPKAKTFERVAYFDSEAGEYRAVLTVEEAGTYLAELYRNGIKSQEPPLEPIYPVKESLGQNYIRFDPTGKGKFYRSDGTTFFPFGYNLGWHRSNEPALESTLAEMADSGLTWTRIWASSWDRKNPWWTVAPEDEASEGQLSELVINRIAHLFDAVRGKSLSIQFALFDARSLSTPQWAEHPWNKAKGGFLDKASDFFTDPEAKRRTKMWIRMASARLGASPNLFAWELLSRADQTDAAKEGKWSDIAGWTKEMCACLRSVDPLGHPITLGGNLPTEFGKGDLDFDQKTFNFEMAIENGNTSEQQVVRGLLNSVLSEKPAADQLWPWEKVDARTKEVYKQLAVFSTSVRMKQRFNVKPLSLLLLGGKTKFDAIGTSDWMAVHAVSADPADSTRELKGIFLKDGDYEAQIWDLTTYKRAQKRFKVKSFNISGLVEGGKDVLIQLERVGP